MVFARLCSVSVHLDNLAFYILNVFFFLIFAVVNSVISLSELDVNCSTLFLILSSVLYMLLTIKGLAKKTFLLQINFYALDLMIFMKSHVCVEEKRKVNIFTLAKVE